jgi:hypothetical protein
MDSLMGLLMGLLCLRPEYPEFIEYRLKQSMSGENPNALFQTQIPRRLEKIMLKNMHVLTSYH